VTKTTVYYPVAGAMRINGTLYYTLKDHLGSASVVTDSTGAVVGEQRYYPFGETRLTTGTIYTDKLFTGQREMAGLGIYHYGARFYSPKLGRFLSADSMVPNAANPQAFNRYSYVRNNPLRYTDPSGNIPIDCYNDPSYCSNTTTLPSSPYKPKPSGGNTPRVTNNNAPAISVPTPSVTPTPSLVSSTATPTSTAMPSTPAPTICLTPSPGQVPSCSAYPNNNLGTYYTIGWDPSLVLWDEVALDAGGLVGDLVPILQAPATIAEGAKIYNHGLNVAEIYLDAYDVVNSDDLAQVDWINVGLDVASFAPGFGAVPSAVGLVYNLSQGFHLVEHAAP